MLGRSKICLYAGSELVKHFIAYLKKKKKTTTKTDYTQFENGSWFLLHL